MSSPTAGGIDRLDAVGPSPLGRLAHLWYWISITGKGLLGAAQIAGGIALALAPAGALPRIVDWLTRNELAEDPTDPLSVWLHAGIAHVPPGHGGFYVVYLLIHGALNLGLVLALVAGLRWAYPASILALTAFVLYQIWKFTLTGDPIMLLLSAIDVAVILAIWHEWATTSRKQAT